MPTLPSDRRPPAGLLVRVAAAGLILATTGIHLDLYLTGYRHIPTIGPLFLLQVIAGFLVAVAVLAVPAWQVALLAAGFVVSTLGGYILSLWVGLFSFHEVRTTAGIAAGSCEVAAFALLIASAVWFDPQPGAPALLVRALEALRRAVAPLAALAVLALVLAVTEAAPAGTAAPAGGGGTAASGSVHVTISNFTFIPAHLTVQPGTRIVVTNKDSVTHTFSSLASSGAGHFSTGDVAPGATVTVSAPRAAGTYAFDCQIHPFMTGSLTVQ